MKGMLRIMVLNAISKGEEISGYSIIKNIKEDTGFWKPSTGSVYPLLNKLTKEGIIKSRTSGRKKLYSLSKKGHDHILKFRKAYSHFADHLMDEMAVFQKLTPKADLKALIEVIAGLKKGVIPFRELNPELLRMRQAFFGKYSEIRNNKQKLSEMKKLLNETTNKLKKI